MQSRLWIPCIPVPSSEPEWRIQHKTVNGILIVGHHEYLITFLFDKDAFRNIRGDDVVLDDVIRVGQGDAVLIDFAVVLVALREVVLAQALEDVCVRDSTVAIGIRKRRRVCMPYRYVYQSCLICL